MSVKGKTALVTGGARGLGEGMAIELAAQGAAVTLVDVQDELGREVAAKINAKGQQAQYIPCDITDQSSVEAAVSAAQSTFGKLDILVNNAAIALPATPITELQDHEITRLLDVNVTGTMRMCRATFEGFRENGSGSVINLSSVHQSHSLLGWSAYAASKGAIIALTRQLAVEWGQWNIRVNSVSPGAIDATMTRAILDADETGKMRKSFQHMHALERLGKTEEVAKTVAFLASDGAAFITGEDILVDGGLTKVCRL
ncbi:SDR family NAD(P)-dependent oxidoreductase [Falsihalocynthiibacter sp. SS001]|uniref:SDR family NAD(P)-dependent oxidoreductase n=1 Tax=Falsihalocynthiibacter sp. SS001 TaxID=3349698 RepID=UPI0036D2300B